VLVLVSSFVVWFLFPSFPFRTAYSTLLVSVTTTRSRWLCMHKQFRELLAISPNRACFMAVLWSPVLDSKSTEVCNSLPKHKAGGPALCKHFFRRRNAIDLLCFGSLHTGDPYSVLQNEQQPTCRTCSSEHLLEESALRSTLSHTVSLRSI
jgi:hypothetical protein